MKSGATAPETFIGAFPFIFFRALTKPVGVRMNFTAEESAAYSRLLEIASWTRATRIGARIARIIPMTIRTAFEFPLSLPPEIEEKKRLRRKISEIIAIIPTSTAVRVMNLMS